MTLGKLISLGLPYCVIKWDNTYYMELFWELNKTNHIKHYRQFLVPSSSILGYHWHPLWTTSVQFSCSVVSDSLRPHRPQHTRPSCPSPTPRVYPNSCPLNQWWHPTISSSVVPFSSFPQSFPASGSFPMSQFFASGS